MPDTVDVVNVFVTYSHQDADYLADDNLLGYLKGLERDNVVFWTDCLIRAGECWDAVIKTNIQNAAIALVLVSQAFLDSPYCQDVEISGFLAQKSHLFPIILSPCEWQRHDWLHRRQFLPGGNETIEEHYTAPGRRKGLFLKIRQQLRERVELIRQERTALGRPSDAMSPLVSDPGRSPEAVTPPDTMPRLAYSGRTKIEFLRRLGQSWRDLATYVGIPAYEQDRFERGDEGRQIWVWLENRTRLHRLPPALIAIERQDLADLLRREP